MRETASRPSRTRDAGLGILAAIGASALVGLLSGVEFALVLLPLAGVVVGVLVRDQAAGLAGLVIGYAVVAFAWGIIVVSHQIESCRPDCVGLSSPSITVVVVIVVALMVELAAFVGFVLGRLGRHIVRPNRIA